MRRWLPWLLLALMVGAGLGYVLIKGRIKEAPPAGSASTLTESLLTKPYTEEGVGYSISAAYPTTTPAGEAAAEEMQGWVIGEISHFKDHIASGTPSTLTITYEASSTATAASYLFVVSENGTIATKSFVFKKSATSTP